MAALRVGLVGTGDAGKHHARALCALHAEGTVDFAAITSRDLTRADATLAVLGAPATTRAYADLASLLASGTVDAVILATPDGLHAEQSLAALAAGKHVLCEKPLALSAREARRAVDAAHAAQRVLAVGYHLRHHAGHVALRERLDELVGVVRAIDVRWAWPDPARALASPAPRRPTLDGGPGWRARGEAARWWSLAALGTHAVDLVLWFSVAAPVEVRAITTPPGALVDHAADLSMRLASGALAHVYCAITHRETPRLLVSGDAGEIEALGTLGARGEGTITARRGRAAPVTIPFTPIDPYLAQMRAFVARIAAGDVAPDAHTVTNLEILEQVPASN